MESNGKTPERLRVLEQYTHGRPNRIKNLSSSNAGYDKALQILNENFDRQDQQLQDLKGKIRKLPTAFDKLNSLRDICTKK